MNKQQLFKTAWTIAKEGAAKFGGSSKEYFAESLKLAYILQGGIEMTYTLEIPVGNKRTGKKQFWAAKIAGTDPKWGFKREFLEPSDSTMSTKTYDLEDGVYNFVAYHGQEFIVVNNGEAKEIQKEEVINYI